MALTLSVPTTELPAQREAKPASGPLAAFLDGVTLMTVLAASALAVAVFAVAAPVAIAISAVAGLFTKAPAAPRWSSSAVNG